MSAGVGAGRAPCPAWRQAGVAEGGRSRPRSRAERRLRWQPERRACVKNCSRRNRQPEPQGSWRSEAVPWTTPPQGGVGPGAVLVCPLAGACGAASCSALLFFSQARRQAVCSRSHAVQRLLAAPGPFA